MHARVRRAQTVSKASSGKWAALACNGAVDRVEGATTVEQSAAKGGGVRVKNSAAHQQHGATCVEYAAALVDRRRRVQEAIDYSGASTRDTEDATKIVAHRLIDDRMIKQHSAPKHPKHAPSESRGANNLAEAGDSAGACKHANRSTVRDRDAADKS